MSEKFTVIRVPGGNSQSAFADRGDKSVEDMISLIRSYALEQKKIAEEILGCKDEDFNVKIVRGAIVQRPIKTLQAGRKKVMSLFIELESRGIEPRYHGNGMIQVYSPFNKYQRLHIWDQGFRRLPSHNAMIHDHVFDMKSNVVVGTLNHQIFEVIRKGDPSEHTSSIFEGIPETKKINKTPVWQGVLKMTHAVNVGAGCNYFQSARTFHSSIPLGDLVISVISKSNPKNDLIGGGSRIVCPIGEEPFSAFEEKIPKDDLLNAVEKALGKCDEETQNEILRLMI